MAKPLSIVWPASCQPIEHIPPAAARAPTSGVHSTTAGSLQQRAIHNYPDNDYLQAEWLRAIGVVRSTKIGWRLDTVVPRTPGGYRPVLG